MKIEKCLYCGNKTIDILCSTRIAHAYCRHCGARGPAVQRKLNVDDHAEAIVAWNKRKEPYHKEHKNQCCPHCGNIEDFVTITWGETTYAKGCEHCWATGPIELIRQNEDVSEIVKKANKNFMERINN